MVKGRWHQHCARPPFKRSIRDDVPSTTVVLLTASLVNTHNSEPMKPKPVPRITNMVMTTARYTTRIIDSGVRGLISLTPIGFASETCPLSALKMYTNLR